MTTYTSQPDATSGIDTYVQEAAPTTAAGTNANLIVAGSGSSRNLALVKFDLSSIPAGADVSAATLSLWSNVTSPAADILLSVYRVLDANSGWAEGATWDYADGSAVRWAGDSAANGGSDAGCSVSGTDYTATAAGTVTVLASTASGTKFDITLTDTVIETMLSGNNGFLLGSNNTANLRFRSSDHGTASTRPKLVIEYTATITGVATISGSGNLAGSGLQIALGQATISGNGNLVADGSVGGATVSGAAALSGAGSLTGSGLQVAVGQTALSGVGSLEGGEGFLLAFGLAWLTGNGNLVARSTEPMATPAGRQFVVVGGRSVIVGQQSRRVVIESGRRMEA